MICWYCSVREAEEKHAYSFDMYGDVDAQKMETQTDVAYKVRHIAVPRCADCHGKHRLAAMAMFGAVVLAILAIAAALNSIFNWTGPWVAGLWLGLSAGLLFGALLAIRLVQLGICSRVRSRTKYAEVQELLKLNYRFGVRPKKK